jgi:cyclophilin family peptidyl-prolyl cis-trans isomerase
VAKSTHDKQLDRARQKRQQDRLAQRRDRSRVLVFVLVGLLVLALLGGALISGLDSGGSPTVDDEPETTADEPDPATDDPSPGEEDAELAAGERPEGACPPTPDDVPEVDSQRYDEAPEMVIDEDETYTATLATTCGDIVVELDVERAPVTVNNFVFLAEEGYYDGVGFHRVIDGFMIQGGDPAGTGCGKDDCLSPGGETFPGYTVPDELEGAEAVVEETGGYPPGSLAMANTGQPDSGGAQFFIIQAEDGYPLPPQYALFGRVLEGQEVVDAIALGPVTGDAATDPVIITSVTIATG